MIRVLFTPIGGVEMMMMMMMMMMTWGLRDSLSSRSHFGLKEGPVSVPRAPAVDDDDDVDDDGVVMVVLMVMMMMMMVMVVVARGNHVS
jgi:hypothetical protein